MKYNKNTLITSGIEVGQTKNKMQYPECMRMTASDYNNNINNMYDIHVYPFKYNYINICTKISMIHVAV